MRSCRFDNYGGGVSWTLRPSASITVDVVMLAVRDAALSVLLVRRGNPPQRGRWALPGGFVDDGEDLPDAAARELEEETGLGLAGAHVEQLAAYGTPGRDPRGRVVTIAYLAFVAGTTDPNAGSDAAAARWVPVRGLLDHPRRLAFDHHRILTDAVERASERLEHTTLGTALCPEELTVAELRLAYEAVWDTALDPHNFHRKVTGTAGFLVPTGRTTTRHGGRPAQLYRRGTATHLRPALLRPR